MLQRLIKFVTQMANDHDQIIQHIAYYKSPVGITRIIAEDGFITSISIRDEEHEILPTDDPALQKTIKQLDEYFAGERKEFDLPIKQPGSAFLRQNH